MLEQAFAKLVGYGAEQAGLKLGGDGKMQKVLVQRIDGYADGRQ